MSPSRIGSAISCIIASISVLGSTLAQVSDYAVSSTASASITLATANSGASYTFATTPATYTTAFAITALVRGSVMTNGAQSYPVYGTPTTASTLACTVGSPPRSGTAITCTITVSGSSGATTGIASDFTISSTVSASITPTAVNGGLQFTFATTPPTYTSSFFISVKVGGVAINGGAPIYTVYGTPTTASTLVCVAGSPQRALSPIACTLSVSGAPGAVTGIAADFAISSSAAASITPTAVNGGLQFTFSTTPPANTLAFVITVTVGGANIVTGPLSYLVYGNPTTASTIVCSPGSPQRQLGSIPCTITVSGAGGATTALASDFTVSSASAASITPTTNNGGITFTFTTATPFITSSFAVNALVGPNVISGGNPTYIVYGNPTTASSLLCVNFSPQRALSAINCTITPSDANGATTAIPSDFSLSSTASASITPLLVNGGHQLTFSTTPPTNNTAFVINVLIGGNTISLGSLSYLVYGNPTTASSLVCSPPSPLRTGYSIPCVLSVSGNGGATTALVTDFLALFTIASAYQPPSGSTTTTTTTVSTTAANPYPGYAQIIPSTGNGGATFSFAVVPTLNNTAFGILVSVAGLYVTGGQPSYTIYGNPIPLTTLTCIASVPTRVGTAIACTISVFDANGPSTALQTDFAVSSSANPSIVPISYDGGATYLFSTKPATNSSAFLVSVTLTSSGLAVLNGSQSFTVFGIATTSSNSSVLACGSAFRRVGGPINCTITVRNAAGPTTGVWSDFNITTSAGQLIIPTTSDSGATFQFSTTPLTNSSAFAIVVTVSGTSNVIVNGSQSFPVYGTPTTASTLTCVAGSPQRAGGSISCTVSVSGTTGATTGVASDFTISSSSAASITPVTANNGSTFTFSTSTPSTASAFAITVATAGATIAAGLQTFIVYGTPTTATTLSCSVASPARAGVAIACSFSVSGATGATTAVAADFAVASSANASIVPTPSNGGLNFSFATTPQSNTTAFSITVRVGA